MSLPDTIAWKDGRVHILDQSRLPSQIAYIECRIYQEVIEAIRHLKIRGAPAIGIAGAMGAALGAQSIETEDPGAFSAEFQAVCRELAAARPTAVNLAWAVERMKRLAQAEGRGNLPRLKERLVQEAIRIWQEDIETNRSIGKHGAELVQSGHTILTHCNAGALATGGYGTALGVVRTAWEQGKKIQVVADETRPVLQGARLTAWELKQEQIPVTLITDSMAAAFMKKGTVDLCIVGADRIAANGDAANKIGTYGLAVLAHHHGIPFFVAAPVSTIDFSLDAGEKIPIEERNPEEVTHFPGQTSNAPDGIRVANPAFDVTPAELITAIITEKGIFKPGELGRLKALL